MGMAIAERPTRTFRDLRDWLRRIDDMGELRVVRGASADEEIGMATELAGRVHGTPALLFDEIPGYKKGFRVLSNGLGWFPRLALTLGLDPKMSPEDLVRAWQKRVSEGITPIPSVEVKDGPIFENVKRGADVDMTIFPAPKWHENDGGRYIGTGSFDITRDPDNGWVHLRCYRVIVIEGWVDPKERIVEGPFGEWTGYYASDARPEPFMQVEAVYYRNDPIMLGSPPNQPPDEQSFYRAFLRSALLRSELEAVGVPGIKGVWCHEVGGSRLFNAVSIEQRYAGHARQVGHLAATVHAGAYLGRYVIVVDDDIDVMDLNDVVWAMSTRSDPVESIDIIKRAWSGPLDPRIPKDRKGHSSRAIIDATRPFEWRAEFPPVNTPSAEVKQKAKEKFGYLLRNEPHPSDGKLS